ncbi:MAG: pyrroline-5-carboxylate reductase [Candidatus Schekmanbacteria bacterium]|nr:pyrroline-5-carboxylate reductase [Candidatus Schekmanbacteria bacterium]
MGLLKNKKISFIGAGNMAEALVGGLLKKGTVASDHIILSDPSMNRLEHFKSKFTVLTSASNASCVSKGDIIILAVKPQVMANVLKELKGKIKERHLVISIAAGVTTSFIKNQIGNNIKIIRVMPNTPALVGKGISAISGNISVSDEDMSLAEEVMKSVGKTVILDEHFLDAVTGLSGSGPAYVFLIIEALIEGGVASGLPRNIARELVLETILGSITLLGETGKHPGELKEMVTSPGGTTVAGLKVLEAKGVRSALIEAVEAAAKRSKELSGK